MSLLLERLQGIQYAPKKNLPPRIAWHAQFSEPAKLCSRCFAGALACTEVLELLLELLEFVLAQGQGAACCVDLDTQEGERRWLGPTTTENPSFLKSLIRMSIHFLYSS